MLEDYIRPDDRADFEAVDFPVKWVVHEGNPHPGAINSYKLSKVFIWGEAPSHKFH